MFHHCPFVLAFVSGDNLMLMDSNFHVWVHTTDALSLFDVGFLGIFMNETSSLIIGNQDPRGNIQWKWSGRTILRFSLKPYAYVQALNWSLRYRWHSRQANAKYYTLTSYIGSFKSEKRSAKLPFSFDIYTKSIETHIPTCTIPKYSLFNFKES